MREDIEEEEPDPRKPIRGIFEVCCADAEKQSARSMAQSEKQKTPLLTTDD
jgi:hypothetical protein